MILQNEIDKELFKLINQIVNDKSVINLIKKIMKNIATERFLR